MHINPIPRQLHVGKIQLIKLNVDENINSNNHLCSIIANVKCMLFYCGGTNILIDAICLPYILHILILKTI